MSKMLELAKHFEPFSVIPVTVTVAEAEKLLRDAGRDFAVIGDAQQPQTLVQASSLAGLADAGRQALSEVLGQLPPLVLLAGGEADLSSGEVEQFSLLLEQTGAPGVVVYRDELVQGVISWEVISDALSLSTISSEAVRGSYEGLGGNPVIPARIYICLKCAASDPPPPFSVPREGDEAPVCPKRWFHGPMQRKDA